MARGQLLLAICFVSTALIGCGDVLDEPEATAGGTEGSIGPTGAGSTPQGIPGSCSTTPWARGPVDASQVVGGSRVVVAQDCSVVVAGGFASTLDLGGAPLESDGDDFFLARYDELGAHLWSQRVATQTPEASMEMAIDRAGNILLAGRFASPFDVGCGPMTTSAMGVYLAKLDPGGVCLWSKAVGDGTDVQRVTLAVDSDGNSVVAGVFSGWLDLGSGEIEAHSYDVFAAKLDASGERLWARAFVADGTEWSPTVTIDPSGNVILVGQAGGGLDLGGGPLDVSELVQLFVAKLDASGAHLWSRALPGTGSATVYGVAASAFDEIVLAGTFFGTVDLGFGAEGEADDNDHDGFILALRGEGEPLWRRVLAGPHQDTVRGVACDAAGSFLLTGELSGSIEVGDGAVLESVGHSNGYLLKYDGAGHLRSSHRFGGLEEQLSAGVSVAVDLSGNALIAGVSLDTGEGEGEGEGEPSPGAGRLDPFLARIPMP
jgi:hypothetical protein